MRLHSVRILSDSPISAVSGETLGIPSSHSLSPSVVLLHSSLLLCILYDLFCVDLNLTFLPLIDEHPTLCLLHGRLSLVKSFRHRNGGLKACVCWLNIGCIR